MGRKVIRKGPWKYGFTSLKSGESVFYRIGEYTLSTLRMAAYLAKIGGKGTYRCEYKRGIGMLVTRIE